MKTSFKNSFVHCIDKLDIMKKLLFVGTIILFIYSNQAVRGQVNPVYKEVDQILWVVQNIKSVKKGWVEIACLSTQ